MLRRWRWRAAAHPSDLRFQVERIRVFATMLPVLLREPELRTRDGLRFLELKFLLTQWLRYVAAKPEASLAICAQFQNVLRNCDTITYDEDGAAYAYVILHFLDRFHRFQMICAELKRAGLMPTKRPVEVLDVGTGPGPSMFAISDHFRSRFWRIGRHTYEGDSSTRIDYVEQSRRFRDWLHHFTELANYHAPSGVGWAVPFHHGSTHDFGDLEFNRRHSVWDIDQDGDDRMQFVTERIRPDLIVMSNFLTTETQARQVAPMIQDCARNLRHKGLLLVVGARRAHAKYAGVYDVLEKTVLEGRYSRPGYRAWCEPVELGAFEMGYNYSDPWGRQIKAFLSEARTVLLRSLGPSMPAEIDAELAKWTAPSYSHQLHWEVTVYRKFAIPTYKRRKKPVSRKRASSIRPDA